MARFEQFSPGEAPALVLQLNDAGEPITVPNAHLLFTAQFEHQGSDLVLTGDDGQTVVVEDYFTAETLPDLISPEGGRLYASVVESLAGPRAPGQYAQAGSPDGRQPIGQVETLEGSATAQRTDGTVVELQVGTPVFQGDVVATGSGSKVAITFIDKTVFSLSEEARMVLDELVYSPGGDDNSMLINLVQGTFVFVAGEVAPSGDMKVQTPVATLGIRGTTVIATILADGTMKASLVADPPGPDGTPGEVGSYGIFLPDASGNLVLAATVTTTGDNYVVTPTSVTGVPTVVATVPKTTSDLASDTDAIATVYQAFSAAQQRLEQIEQESTEEETDENTDDPDQQNDGDDTTGENDTTPGSGLQDSGIEDAGSDSGPAGDLGGDSESDGDSTPGFTLFETDGSTDGEGEPVLVETTPDFEPIIPDVVVDTPPVVVAPVVTNVTQNAPNVSTVNLLPEGAIVDADDDQLNVVDGSLQQTDGPALDTPPVVNNNFLEFDPSEFSDLGIDESVDLEFEFDVEDEDGEVVTQTLTLTVDGVNDAPTEDVEVPDQFLVQGGQVTVNVPLDAFDDLDTNDTLTLSATLENGDPLPAWLQFNVVAGGPGVPDTGQFIIDGTEDNRGGHRIILIGTDGEGEVATQEIEIKIDPVSTGDVQVGERSVFVDVDPRATYLRTSNDPDTVLNPLDVPNLLAEQAYSFDDPDLPPGVTLMPG
ncbi:MAG: FecR domain-containing protein, partial [Pseudomonadota bacterium]